MKLVDLTDFLRDTEFNIFASAVKNDGVVKAICLKGGMTLTRSQIDDLTKMVKKEGAGGLAYMVLAENNQITSPIAKFLSPKARSSIISKTGATTGDIIFFSAGEKNHANKILGKLRSHLGDMSKLKDPNLIAWAWIVDFPMYEVNSEGKLDFMHNPFSMPKGGLEALESKDPLEIMSYQYDIIANGLELSSGAIRNNRPEIMYKAFELVGYDKKTVDEKFGAMIRAFEYGAPPEGGFAPGIDRMLMLFKNEPNIREVIAFPKNGSAEDVMMSAPSEVNEKQLKELHIKLDLSKKKSS
jgi:aspartyl-tRNA synthetase